VFPQTGIEAMSKITKTSVETLLSDPSKGFRDIPELDLTAENEIGPDLVKKLSAIPVFTASEFVLYRKVPMHTTM